MSRFDDLKKRFGQAVDTGSDVLGAAQNKAFNVAGDYFGIKGTGEEGQVRGADLAKPVTDKAFDYLPESYQQYRDPTAEVAGAGLDIFADPLNLTPAGVVGLPTKALKAAKVADKLSDASKIGGLAQKGAKERYLLKVPGQDALDLGDNAAAAMKVKQQLEATGKIPKGLSLSSTGKTVKKVDMKPDLPKTSDIATESLDADAEWAEILELIQKSKNH